MKKLVISTDTLKPALKKLSQAVNSKAVVPALTNLYCKVGQNKVELITSDLELTIFYTCECETEGAPFEMLIPFDLLQKIVALTGSAPLTIQHPSSRRAKIIGVGDVYELNSLDKPEDFPKLPSVPKQKSFALDETFIGYLGKALLTVCKDDLRPAMTRVCLDIADGIMTVVSTDAHMLYTHKLPVESEEIEKLQVSAKMAKAMEGFKNVELSWHAKNIAVSCDNVLLVATRHEEKYPDYKVIIPKNDPNLPIERNELIHSMERASLVSVIQANLSLLKKPDSIFISAVDEDIERKTEVEIPGTYSGSIDAVAVCPKRMITVLHQIDVDLVRLHIHGINSPIVITSEEDVNYLGIIMPLAIN